MNHIRPIDEPRPQYKVSPAVERAFRQAADLLLTWIRFGRTHWPTVEHFFQAAKFFRTDLQGPQGRTGERMKDGGPKQVRLHPHRDSTGSSS